MATTLALAQETVGADEAAVAAQFIAFLRSASEKRYPTGTMRRYNQGRHAGCVEAEFSVLDTLPRDLRVGLFAGPATYRAWVRFASASSQTDREKDTRGLAIKLYDVPGENLTPGSTVQDFVLNSHPVLVAPTARDFLELLQAVEAGGLSQARYFLTHPRSAMIGFASRQHHQSHLDIAYWSTTPYLFGEGRAVKYIVRPLTEVPPERPRVTDTYLHDVLASRLAASDAAFEFMVQFQTDAARMPIEDASVEWKAEDSPYRAVARLRIPKQPIDDANRMRACEDVSFNPWNSLVDHRPLGSLNRARRQIYASMAAFRQHRA